MASRTAALSSNASLIATYSSFGAHMQLMNI